MIAMRFALHVTPYQNSRHFIQRIIGGTRTLHTVNNFNASTIGDVLRFCFCQTCKTRMHICT